MQDRRIEVQLGPSRLDVDIIQGLVIATIGAFIAAKYSRKRRPFVFDIRIEDLARLGEQEFDEVWSALGKLAKAHTREIRSLRAATTLGKGQEKTAETASAGVPGSAGTADAVTPKQS